MMILKANQNDLLLFLVCLDCFPKIVASSIMNWQPPRLLSFIYFFHFLGIQHYPYHPCMVYMYIYIYIDKHGWYGLRWCLSRLQVYVGEKTHQWQRQIKVFFRDSLLKTSQFWLYWVGGWSQGRCFCLKIFQRYLHIRVSFCLRNTVFIFNVFFFTPPNVKSMRPWKDVAQSPFFGRIFW